ASGQKADIVSHFKQLVEKSVATMAHTGVAHGSDGKWTKIKTWTTDVGIDVQKTSSLVSPYTADASLIFHTKSTLGELTEQQAEQAELPADDLTTSMSLHYALQDRKWVLKKVESKLWSKFWEPRLKGVASDYPAIEGDLN